MKAENKAVPLVLPLHSSSSLKARMECQGKLHHPVGLLQTQDSITGKSLKLQ